jgi:hypothetical protein
MYVDDDGYQRRGSALETGAKGALLGLGIGALTGNAGRGAAIGAISGYGGRALGLFGGKSRKVRKSRKRKSPRRSPKRKSLRR